MVMSSDIDRWVSNVFSACGIAIDQHIISKAPTEWELTNDLLLDDSTHMYFGIIKRRVFSNTFDELSNHITWSELNHDVVFDDNFIEINSINQDSTANYLDYLQQSLEGELTLQSNLRRHLSNFDDS